MNRTLASTKRAPYRHYREYFALFAQVQHFGDLAITWSEYVLEVEKRSKSSGRVTEIFVKRDGQWTNPGWHTDSEGSPTLPPA